MLYTCHAGRVKKEAGSFEKVVTEEDFDGCNVTLVFQGSTSTKWISRSLNAHIIFHSQDRKNTQILIFKIPRTIASNIAMTYVSSPHQDHLNYANRV